MREAIWQEHIIELKLELDSSLIRLFQLDLYGLTESSSFDHLLEINDSSDDFLDGRIF